jgi:hypothetical protein
MGTAYDIGSVALFFCVVAAFVFLTDRQPGALLRLLLTGFAIAVANQLGNLGLHFLAAALLLGGVVNALITVRAFPASND